MYKIKSSVKEILAVLAIVLVMPIMQACTMDESGASSQPNINAKLQLCTADVNEYGHASSCNCPEGGTYNAMKGMCLDDISVINKAIACTMDINEYGFSSMCQCPVDHYYHPDKGTCSTSVLQTISAQNIYSSEKPIACSRDLNRFGFPSLCQCPDNQSYFAEQGVCTTGQPLVSPLNVPE
jgi:hypothetical protein